MPFNLLVLACFLYVAFLFTVAFMVEGRAARATRAATGGEAIGTPETAGRQTPPVV